jgi:PleD family two-component response regulator
MKDIIDTPLTFSGGLIEVTAEDAMTKDIKSLIERADKLMYKAKSLGRNRIEVG